MRPVKLFATALFLSGALMFSAHAADTATYEANMNEVVKAIASGTVDVDALVAKLDAATAIGVEMAKEVAAKDAKGKPLLDHLIANLDKVKGATLESVEHDWHHGHAFKDAGIDHDGFDHYGAVIGAKDAVVHPITAAIALKSYKADKNAEHLEQAQSEIEEMLGQLKYVK